MMLRFRNLFKQPPLNTIAPNTVGAKEVGWSESKLYNGPFPKYNPDDLIGRKGAKIYRQMLVDEQVKAVVRFKRDAITSRDTMFVMPDTDGHAHQDDRIHIYETMVRETYGSFVDGMNYILMAMWQGFSMTEKIFDVFEFKGKPYIGIKQLIPKPFDTFEFDVDEFGRIRKTIQKIDNKEQVIDLNRFVYFVQNPEFDRHYGQSDLREAYRSWYSKDIIIRFYNQFLERFSGGFVIGKPTQGSSLVPGTPDYNAMLAAMASIQNQTSILLPHNIELDVVRPATTDQFERAIATHDLAIAKALLVPNLLGITPQASTSGGFAQANTQLEAFLWTLDADASRLEEALNEQIFAPLNKLNFADGMGPLIKFKAISDTKKMELIKTWQELVTAGAVEASNTDEEHVRELLGFPDKGEPLDLETKIGEANSIPPQSRDRGPVKEPNQQRTNNSATFSRAQKRVSFSVIEKKAGSAEDKGVVRLEASIADLVGDITARIAEEKLGTNETGFAPIKTLDFNPKLKAKANSEIANILFESWAIGSQHAKTEISRAKGEALKINMERIDEDADEYIKATAFLMFGAINDDMRAIIQNVLTNAIKFSWTPQQTKNKIYDELMQQGFISQASNVEGTGRVIDEIAEGIGRRLGDLSRIKTGVRTNVFEAINESRYAVFTDPSLDGFIEGLEYSAILDDRTTDICRHLDDRIYPVNAPEWNRYRPPNHFNCRSLLVPITIVDSDVIGRDNAPGERWSRSPSIDPQKGFG